MGPKSNKMSWTHSYSWVSNGDFLHPYILFGFSLTSIRSTLNRKAIFVNYLSLKIKTWMHIHCLSLDRGVTIFLFMIYFTDFTIFNLCAVDYNQTDKIKCSNCTN